MRPEEVAWAAGLFEGEGCFTGASRGRACMKLQMTDESVVRRFHRTLGLGNVSGPFKPTGLGTRFRWEWRSERFEHTQALVAMFWPWLSQRRRDRAVEVLMLMNRNPALVSQMFGKKLAQLNADEMRIYRNEMAARYRSRRVAVGG